MGTVAMGEIKKKIKQKHPEFAACGVVLAPGRHVPLNCENSVFPNIHSSLVNRSSIDVSCDEWFHFKCPARLASWASLLTKKLNVANVKWSPGGF